MGQLLADRRDVDFVLFEQMNVEQFTKFDKYADFGKKTIDMIISEARSLAIKEILPTQVPGDVEGCKFDNGKVTVPPCFHKAFDNYKKGDWLAAADSHEVGGQGMPKTVYLAANEFFQEANVAFMLYHGLTHGAAKLIEEFGTPEQKKLYMKKLFSGEWAGTMLLTEPEAGSDVGALTTVAKKNADGTYSISGNKIFISGGDHDMAANFIHPVLARIEGAPEGTRGISLFAVPKFRVNADGSLGEFNDVVCTGIEHKMGIHGNCTCSLTLGGAGNCIGTLLGEENKGMAAMFKMMNEARQLVGMQGFAVASASYMYALNYARERVQSKHITKPSEPAVPIIQHPDVRRQLLLMKSYVEGMRSLIYYSGICFDTIATADAETAEKYSGIIEVLTPIIKGYITDRSLDVCSHGIQVYGGYGFIEEYPVAQLFRDSRIFMIYEGTNGIQAMDLLGRKLGMKKGQVFMSFLGEIKKIVEEAKKTAGLEALVQKFEAAFGRYSEIALTISKAAGSEKVLNAFTFAHPFLEVTGDITFAWMLLWRAMAAKKAMDSGAKKKDAPFYEGQIKTAEFFIDYVIPVTRGKMDAIEIMNGAAVEMDEESFGGK